MIVMSGIWISKSVRYHFRSGISETSSLGYGTFLTGMVFLLSVSMQSLMAGQDHVISAMLHAKRAMKRGYLYFQFL